MNDYKASAKEKDTIDLLEMWEVLKKRKFTIIISVGLFLIIAFTYIGTAKPVFEAQATLVIGRELVKTQNGTLVADYFDDPKTLKKYIDVKYDTNGKYSDGNTSSHIDKVVVSSGNKEFLNIHAIGSNIPDILNTLNEPINEIISKHRIYYNMLLKKKKNIIENLEEQIIFNKYSVLPQIKNSLNFLQNIELKKIDDKIKLIKEIDLKKIDDKIKLIKEIDLKKIDDKIKFLKKEEIPSIEKKIKEGEHEIMIKEDAVRKMQHKIAQVAQQNPTLATMTIMQIANLQNDISRLKIHIIDFKSAIKKLEGETIPYLQKEKIRILQETIPTLEKKKIRILKSTIPDLEAQKKKITEEAIPSKKASIKKLEAITIPELKTRIQQVKLSMQEPYIVMTKILGKIYFNDKPVKPKKKLIIAVALISGLMLGIFLAFFLEFIAKKAEEKAS